MLEWKTIKLEGKSFIGMHLVLPRQGLYIITSTKCILVGNMFQIHKMTPYSCVFIMEKSNSYQALLNSRVLHMNAQAKAHGYELGMKGKEVLLYETARQNQKEI